MAEQTFKSPGYFETELDNSAVQEQGPVGTPAGVIGTSGRGPAFVPTTVRSFADFTSKFGGIDPKKFAPYAVRQFLENRTALTFCKVLGAGANSTTGDISKTLTTGQVKNAGFVITGTLAGTRHKGAVQFITARHIVQNNEAYGMPMFTNNDSYSTGAPFGVNLVRGMIMLASGTRMMVLDGNADATSAFTTLGPIDQAQLTSGKFKLVLSSSNGASFGTTDGNAGIKIYTASLNPSSADYYAKVLNTDPDKFADTQHFVYADFPVDDEVASSTTVGLLSGSAATNPSSGDPSMAFRDAFGHFDTRYTSPKTTWFISQPFGNTEYDLFKFEAKDDGEVANLSYKISISNLKVSTDAANPYGTFTVLIRDWNDTDTNVKVLEQFSNCSLNPNADNYVAKVIGDKKVHFNFDAENDDERRLVIEGKYGSNSAYVRIVMSDAVERGLVPQRTLPFGFRGPELLKTSDGFTNSATNVRFAGVLSTSASLTSSLLPPLPLRFKVTKGAVATSGFIGNPGIAEITDGNLYWGVKFERNNDVLNANSNSEKNDLLANYAKFIGIKQLDSLLTGSAADVVNNNKFTLAKVALSNTVLTDLTASVSTHMKEAAYIRNGKVDPSNYTITDSTLTNRITLGTLLAQTSSIDFNRFNGYAKFTNFLYGGFDGVNVVDKNARRLNDKATSFDVGGCAESTYLTPGLAYNPAGTSKNNNAVASYVVASKIMTDPMAVKHNILAVPGIRETYITDQILHNVKEYGLAIYLMDLPLYDSTGARVYDDSVSRPDVNKVVNASESRAVDNNYASSYFPDVVIKDPATSRRIKVPASVAALAAIGYNDRVSYPWYAPAGFNRASLDFVVNTSVRLNKEDRDRLYDARINPIASMPREGFVIWGQKTLQQANTSLNRVNVRRLVLEVKRQITEIAFPLVFEQNIPSNRTLFVNEANTRLGLIQLHAGLEKFKVVMDSTNNSDEDVNLNRLNGRIELAPTRTIEFISIDFIITNNGLIFV